MLLYHCFLYIWARLVPALYWACGCITLTSVNALSSGVQNPRVLISKCAPLLAYVPFHRFSEVIFRRPGSTTVSLQTCSRSLTIVSLKPNHVSVKRSLQACMLSNDSQCWDYHKLGLFNELTLDYILNFCILKFLLIQYKAMLLKKKWGQPRWGTFFLDIFSKLNNNNNNKWAASWLRATVIFPTQICIWRRTLHCFLWFWLSIPVDWKLFYM